MTKYDLHCVCEEFNLLYELNNNFYLITDGYKVTSIQKDAIIVTSLAALCTFFNKEFIMTNFITDYNKIKQSLSKIAYTQWRVEGVSEYDINESRFYIEDSEFVFELYSESSIQPDIRISFDEAEQYLNS